MKYPRLYALPPAHTRSGKPLNPILLLTLILNVMNLSESITAIRIKTKIPWFALVMALLISGCSSDEPVEDPSSRLPYIRPDETSLSISLNEEQLTAASAYFTATPLSDEVRLVMKGVHPSEKIDLAVTATFDKEGNIVFEGSEYMENLREIHVTGQYTRSESGENVLDIDVTYTVPGANSSREYVIPFDGHNGFLYNRDPGQYPMCKWDIEGQRDTCQSICKTINSEVARELKSLSFKFENNGRLTLSSTDHDLNVTSQSFRYWLRTVSRDTLVNVENPALFYDFILNALNLNKKTAPDQYSYVPEYETAEIYVEGTTYLNNFKFNSSVVIRDDLRHKIFSYVRDKYQDCDTWGDRERRFLNTMETVARRNYDGRNYSMPIYEWGFATWRE